MIPSMSPITDIGIAPIPQVNTDTSNMIKPALL
jgi:hypothetical protein